MQLLRRYAPASRPDATRPRPCSTHATVHITPRCLQHRAKVLHTHVSAISIGSKAPELPFDAAWKPLRSLPFIMPTFTIIAALAILKVVPVAPVPVMLAPPLIMHGIGPLIDLALGELPPPTQDGGGGSMASRALPLLYCVPQLVGQVLACMAAGALWAAQGPAALPQLVLLTVCTGVSVAVGMSSSHELMHSRRPIHQAAASLQLAWALLWVYSRSHHHHHLHVGTSEDNTTAHAGESFYAFMWRYLSGSHRVAWAMEAQEARRRGRRVWSPMNRMLQGLALQAFLLAVSWVVGGPAGLCLHVGAAVFGVTYLLAVDYLLHYGLERGTQADGSPEPYTTYNAFNSAYLVENSLLFRVLIHSDHHHVASKPYTRLGFAPSEGTPGQPPAAPRLLPGVPMLLASLAVFVPPLWFRLVDSQSTAANAAHKEALLMSPGATRPTGRTLTYPHGN